MHQEPFRLLFVCLGNICRSPAADGVMRDVVAKAGLQNRIEIDSAGTEGWHSGKLPDSRMRQAAQARGITLDHRARQFKAADLDHFDLILAMDRDNERNIRALDRENRHTAKIRLFCEYCTEHTEHEVPDPYYGGPEGFEHVLDLLEDGCEGLLREVKTRL